jgi:hypothetical protein
MHASMHGFDSDSSVLLLPAACFCLHAAALYAIFEGYADWWAL